MIRTTEEKYRLMIRDLLELCLESDLNSVNMGLKSLEQHEKDCKDLEFYVQLLKSEGSLQNLPSKYAELALGKFRLLLNVYKEL